jgi:hypothetical protein
MTRIREEYDKDKGRSMTRIRGGDDELDVRK